MDAAVLPFNWLETLRALKAGRPQLNENTYRRESFLRLPTEKKNGLFGARAVCLGNTDGPPTLAWRSNFDARGNTGPVIMFETSENIPLGYIEPSLRRPFHFPVAHSLSL
jgi:hypothetical protein